MDLENIFTDSKWRILTELSHQPMSPSQLAESTSTSIPNISTQLRLLEALDLVSQEKLDNVAKGEPRKLFSLKKNFSYLILGSNSVIGKRMLNLEKDQIFLFSVWFITEQGIPETLMRLYLENADIFENAVSIGYLGLKNNEIELLVLADNPDPFFAFNHKEYAWKKKQFKFNMHVHKISDFETGLKKGEDYFKSTISKVFILNDSKNILSDMKKGVK